MKLFKLLMVGASLFYAAAGMAADAKIKTFILADKKAGDVATVAAETKAKLTKAGFEVVGTYSPYDTATILIVTNDELKAHAKQSEMGAYGAAQRVTITKAGSDIQVAFTNPTNMAHIYRLKGDLKAVTAKLKSALGDKGEYGPEKYSIRRYQKQKGQYMPKSKFNISSSAQAQKIVDALSRWTKEG